MLIRFRQKLMGWLREADWAPGGDRFDEIDEANHPGWHDVKPKYANRNISIGQAINSKHMAGLAKLAGSKTVSVTEELSHSRNSLRFNVIPGSGGIAVEVQQYDSVQDDRVSSLHVIPEDADLAQELAKIITMQSMRHR